MAELGGMNGKLAYRIDEAVKASGLGRSFLYERMADGSLKSVKVGGRRLILRDDLMAFLTCETPVSLTLPASSRDAKNIRGSKQKGPTRAATRPVRQMILPLE
ncbi:MAG: excisionase family DNA-binding protein [Asticcacaulis sp.]|jgi:excisionase family DNA binding protein|uniref:helix-turn-helix domain-containing protein n=1 Tax=Asticcacaulis sp. TaxID=1872648 RepID=UPI0025C4B5B1|nr:excisionase family DNA-binding protein [Asticcacaulis sp.]MCA1936971.1 excisionase family DNA-binding protein [Asticcacaulis sp.]